MTTPGGTRVRIVHERDVPDPGAWLDATEAETLAGLHVPKRRSDWLRGRWAAKQAVAQWAGLDDSLAGLAGVAIRPAPDGAPEVRLEGAPAPVVSITHSGSWGAAALASRGPLGCDLEQLRPLDDSTVDLFFTEAERSEIRSEGSQSERVLRTILIWSAKESALKALRTGLRRDTREVEVAAGPMGPAGWGPFTVRDTADGRVFAGWWRTIDGFVLTVVEAEDIGAPAGG